jgi:Delta24-sterol reductase
LFDIYWGIRNWVFRTFLSAPHEHQKRVDKIIAQMRKWDSEGRKGLLHTNRPGWAQMSTRVAWYKSTAASNAIDIDLFDILEIDTTRRIVRAEPLVNVGQLSKRLVAMGWTMPIVPEMDDLTLSGLLLGYGIEGSSHKYGLFCDIVRSVDVLTGDFKVVHCSPTENADLFNALPWSYGALGFVVAMELEIVPVKPFVRLTYHPCHSQHDFVRTFQHESTRTDPSEFVEAILYEPQRGVVMTGNYCDASEVEADKKNSIGWWFKPWFYKHAQTFLDYSAPQHEYIPVREYYHRHTRSIFWEGDLIIPIGSRPWFRYLLGWLMPPKVSFLRLTEGELVRKFYEDRHVVQEALVPTARMSEYLQMFHDTFECYPLWMCPHKMLRTEPRGYMYPSNDQGIIFSCDSINYSFTH